MSSKKRRKTAWLQVATFATAETVVAANVLTTQTILAGVNLGDEEVTIARVLGDYRIQNNSGAENLVHVGITLQDANLTPALSRNPRLAADAEAWMWWRAFWMASGTSISAHNVYADGGGAGGCGIDIRARRRFSALDDNLVFNCIGTGTFDFGQCCRVLVWLP